MNWAHQLGKGGSLTLNTSLTVNLHEMTQDTAQVAKVDWKGFGPPNNGPGAACALQLQCLNYGYRVFTTVGYGRGMWNVQLQNQYWPSLPNVACRTPGTGPTSIACRFNSLPAYSLFAGRKAAVDGALEALQRLACDRIDHLLMKARVALRRIESAADQDVSVLQVHRVVVFFLGTVIVDDRKTLAHGSGLQRLVPN